MNVINDSFVKFGTYLFRVYVNSNVSNHVNNANVIYVLYLYYKIVVNKSTLSRSIVTVNVYSCLFILLLFIVSPHICDNKYKLRFVVIVKRQK